LPSAPLLLGEIVLNTMYGLELNVGYRPTVELLDLTPLSRLGSSAGGGSESQVMPSDGVLVVISW
jgi:hypothetical protein